MSLLGLLTSGGGALASHRSLGNLSEDLSLSNAVT
jgi:hypothetical protein